MASMTFFLWICSALLQFFQYITFKKLLLLVYSITLRHPNRCLAGLAPHSFSDGAPMEKNCLCRGENGRFRKK